MEKASSGFGGGTPPIFKDQPFWYVYLLNCNDQTTYTGCTNDLPDRLKRHSKGQISYTKTRLPFELVTYIAFNNKYRAYKFEKYLKSGSGKAFSNKRLI